MAVKIAKPYKPKAPTKPPALPLQPTVMQPKPATRPAMGLGLSTPTVGRSLTAAGPTDLGGTTPASSPELRPYDTTTRLVRRGRDEKVYAVGPDGKLTHVPDAATFEQTYGADAWGRVESVGRKTSRDKGDPWGDLMDQHYKASGGRKPDGTFNPWTRAEYDPEWAKSEGGQRILNQARDSLRRVVLEGLAEGRTFDPEILERAGLAGGDAYPDTSGLFGRTESSPRRSFDDVVADYMERFGGGAGLMSYVNDEGERVPGYMPKSSGVGDAWDDFFGGSGSIFERLGRMWNNPQNEANPATRRPSTGGAGGAGGFWGGSAINPRNDLRGQAFLPTTDTSWLRNQQIQALQGATLGPRRSIAGTDVSGARARYGEARSALNRLPEYRGPGADAGRARSLTMQALERAMGGTDRAALAARNLELFNRELEDEERAESQRIARQAGALGRVGAQMTTSKFGDLEARLTELREREKTRLALGAAEQELADRMALTQLGSGVGGQIHSEDMADAELRSRLGMDRINAITGLGDRELDIADILRSDAESDRLYDLDYGSRGANLALSKASQFGDIDSRLFGQDLSRRNEMRAERAYQAGQAQQAMDNELRRVLAQHGISEDMWRRWLEEQRLILDTDDGGGTNPKQPDGSSGSSGTPPPAAGLPQNPEEGKIYTDMTGQRWQFKNGAWRKVAYGFQG